MKRALSKQSSFFASRGVGKINSKGLARKPEVRAQMERKHPATEQHDWSIPDEADISMGRFNEILRKADPLVGVGPRGVHSDYLKVLVTGRMMCAESSAAFELFANLGSAYLGAQMPPWLRRRLGAGFLAALCKKAMVPGEVPDARLVKAEDFD